LTQASSPSRPEHGRTRGGGGSSHRWRAYLKAFWDRAYKENITGLSAMVAYNLMLAVFPFALLVLFIFGQLLQSQDIESGVLLDLQRLFPDVERDTLNSALERIRDSSTTIGVAAILAGLWIGASFWGAMDTAFCRIYHVQCRGWMEQKRFSLGMLLVVALFMAASVIVPTAERQVISHADNLPFGLSSIGGGENLLVLAGAVFVTFMIASIIYWAVPKGHMPWRAVWPGAAFLTFCAALLNYGFPFYLGNISSVGEVGGTVGFLLIALIWFYAIALALLAGAVINSLRHELHETGTLPGWAD
jgi:membrane protein